LRPSNWLYRQFLTLIQSSKGFSVTLRAAHFVPLRTQPPQDSLIPEHFTWHSDCQLVVLFSGALFGQAGITASGPSGPAFEAADVHVSPKVRVLPEL